MSESSLTPGAFNEGPERDAAQANRRAFLEWLRESDDGEAVSYRLAVEREIAARRARSRARTLARAAFKRKIRARPAEGESA